MKRILIFVAIFTFSICHSQNSKEILKKNLFESFSKNRDLKNSFKSVISYVGQPNKTFNKDYDGTVYKIYEFNISEELNITFVEFEGTFVYSLFLLPISKSQLFNFKLKLIDLKKVELSEGYVFVDCNSEIEFRLLKTEIDDVYEFKMENKDIKSIYKY